jgi:hypothetical protein
MNHQTRELTPQATFIGRPHWQVSLKASLQRGRKRLKATLCATVLRSCAACQQQALERAA